MKIKTYILVGICLIMAGIVGFCYTKQQGTIVIGINLALSGDAGANGESTERGIILAKNQLNKRGGLLGRQVKLVSVDNHGKPEDAVLAVQQLAMRHVAALIGPNENDCAPAAVLQAVDKKIPMISPASTAENITMDIQHDRVYPNIFRITLLPSWQGRIMASYAMEICHAENIAVFYDDATDSHELATHFKDAVEQHGGTVSLYQQMVDGDMATAISVPQDCRAVYMPVQQDKAAMWIQSLRDKGITIPVLGPESWQGDVLAAKVPNGDLQNVFYISQYAADVNDELSEDFAEAYYEMYGELPDTYAALGYDACMMLAKAIENGQSVDNQDVISQLETFDIYQGVTGDIRFDQNHNPRKPGYIWTFWGNEPIILGKQHAADI